MPTRARSGRATHRSIVGLTIALPQLWISVCGHLTRHISSLPEKEKSLLHSLLTLASGGQGGFQKRRRRGILIYETFHAISPFSGETFDYPRLPLFLGDKKIDIRLTCLL